jgi:serine/threonine protein kinase
MNDSGVPPNPTSIRPEARPDEAARTRIDREPTHHGAAPTLRRQSVADEAGTRIRELASADTKLDVSPAEAIALRKGSVVHDWYVLEEMLGIGAMGQVWKAKDLQLDRARVPDPYVALKLVNAEFARHEHAMEAMSREADKAKKVAHPNNASVFVFAVDPGTGQAYLAMELLEGKPLDRVVAEHPMGMPRDLALEIVRGLARGLAYAHSQGVVHCDFKPSNAFLTNAGAAKVLDYGIARLASEIARSGDDFDASQLGALTPEYASLEMLQDPVPPPHPSDDVYALGLVAYELLSGRHPFGGLEAIDVLAKGRRLTPLKGVKRHEWRAIERALKLHRADRFPDAQAFLKALDGVRVWVPALGVLAGVLAIAAVYLAHRNYVESQPAVPFEELPVGIQTQFREAMRDGGSAFKIAAELEGAEATNVLCVDAIPNYAQAYALHPKNPEADAALEKSLATLSQRLETESADARTQARDQLEDIVEQHARTLGSYEPLTDLIESLRKQ